MTAPVKILVVDDDPTARLLMRVALQKTGFEVRLAVDGADALRQFSEDSFGLIMLDVDMPGMSGMAVCATLRAQSGEHLPIVMVTGMDDVMSVEAAYEAGATDFITKPINWPLIGRRAHSLVRASHALSSMSKANMRSKQAQEEIRQLNVNLERRVLERTTELQATNQELEAFSYSVSHDLRSPLRAIDGFSQALLEDYADKLDDQGQDYLKRVRSATQRMGHLIDDMLKLSRVTRSEMQRETVDLSVIAADVLVELQKSEPERRVDWQIEPGLVAQGDANLLRVVLDNLLGNAWKFTGKTVNAKIEFGALRHAQGAPGFFVRDNGAGYDANYADKLFGAFQRLHLVSDFPGTGVGLATVQRVIHRHGGAVWAEGAVGKGATFYFSLCLLSAPIRRRA